MAERNTEYYVATITIKDGTTTYFCIKLSSETHLTADLKAIDVPTQILHGDDDQLNVDLLAFIKA